MMPKMNGMQLWPRAVGMVGCPWVRLGANSMFPTDKLQPAPVARTFSAVLVQLPHTVTGRHRQSVRTGVDVTHLDGPGRT